MRNIEHSEQVALFKWADMQPLSRYIFKEGRIGDFLAACPNGGFRTVQTGSMLKAEGVRAGFPDMILTLPNKNHCALFIELKAPTKTARVSENQRCWIDRLNEAGYLAVVAYGFIQAKEIIEKYLRNEI